MWSGNAEIITPMVWKQQLQKNKNVLITKQYNMNVTTVQVL